MIHYVTGNLLDAPAQALVNTVNTVGVMGKGIALQFREAYPENYKAYRQACAEHQLAPGQLLVVREKNLQGEKTIVNFPTKTEWFQPSRYEWIEAGLKALLQAIAEHKIQSIALPPLGCGNGKLEWSKVKPLMERYLSDLDIEVLIYAPNEAVKSVLQAQEQSSRAQLTPARAMLLYGLYHYESMGENSSLFVANKLAWFLQRLGEPLRLTFKAHHYGPYSVQVGHVLYALNGSYLRGLEQNSARPFDPLQLDYASFEAVKNYVDTQLDTAQRHMGRSGALLQRRH